MPNHSFGSSTLVRNGEKCTKMIFVLLVPSSFSPELPFLITHFLTMAKDQFFFLQNLIWSSFGFCAFSSSVCRTYLWSHYNALEENVNLIYTLNTHLSNSRILLIYPRYVSGQCFLGELMVEMGRLI